MFHSLSRSDLARIVDIQLAHLRKLLAERKIQLELTEAAKLHLAEIGYDPTFGARPLKRVIQRELQDPLALRLLQGEFKEGDAIRVDYRNGLRVFEQARQEVSEPVAA
jgi:ATP-dependent Clp protease ATP-binding subunit ClpB